MSIPHRIVPQWRVAVSQRFLPHYRVSFFDELDRSVRENGGALRLFFSYSMGRFESVHSWAKQVPAVRKNVQLGELEESAVLSPGLLWHLIRYSPDVVVLEDLAGLPNSLLGALYCRLWRKPYLIWGLGEVPQKRRSRLRRMLAPAITFLYEGAFGFLCYSEYAAQVYGRYSKPTYVARNSFLPPPQVSEIERIERAIDHRYPHSGLRVLTIGTLKRQKRYDVLLEAIAAGDKKTILHIVGDGPDRKRLQQIAMDLAIADRVTFHGSLYETNEKATLMRDSHIGVIPGRGGLAIQEMMAYGIPVISGVADGTEVDLIREGCGFLLDGFPSAAAITEKLHEFARLSTEEQKRISRGALDVVVKHSNTSTMASAFAHAVKDALHR